MKWTHTTLKFVILSLWAATLVACSGAKFERNANDEKNGGGAICNPFGGGGGSAQNGLFGNIYHLTDGQPRYKRLYDIIQNGHLISSQLFLGNLYVPTRAWLNGFQSQDGTMLKKENGETLVEYFALQLQSNLRLKAGEAAGNYQFALISDDGAVMRVKPGSTDVTLIDHQDVTETQMMCANQPVSLNADSRVPVKIDYFQGPRMHIALTLIWRQWPASGNPQDPLCGSAGNNLFWDSNVTPSAPKQEWNDLMARGWKVVAPQNFELPAGTTNPCN